MTLPKITQPLFTLKLPSTGQTITCRPYLVKEDRILRLAQESKDPQEIHQAVHQIIRNCVQDADVNIDTFATFDIDFIFLNIKGRSNGGTTELDFECSNTIKDDEVCGAEFKAILNLSDIKIVDETKTIDMIKNEVKMDDKLVIKFRFPNLKDLNWINLATTEDEKTYRMTVASIEYVAVGDEKAVQIADMPPEVIKDFIENLTLKQFNVIQTFIENLPHFEINTSATCPKCKFVHEFHFEDLTGFF